MEIRTNAIEVLTETMNQSPFTNLSEYVTHEAENDPTFFRWLFQTDSDDYACPDQQAYEDFVYKIKSL